MENCEHGKIVRIMGGFYCPACGKIFEKRPEKVKTEPKPKKKKASKAE